jgi:hypothetical protein
MDLLSVNLARSVWLFNIDELNPQGKNILGDLIDWLKETYHFEKSPESLDALNENKGLSLTGGEFQVRPELFVQVNLTIFLDGIVGETRSSTKDTDAFLSDALELAIKEFSLTRRSDLIRQKLYVSELWVYCDRHLQELNPKLAHIATRIADLIGSEPKPHFEPASVEFWVDQQGTQSTRPPFVFQRKAQAAFKENRYWSRAPLQTHDHLEVLNDLEKVLSHT